MVTQRSNVVSSRNVGLQKPKSKAIGSQGTETILQSTRNDRTPGFPFIIPSVLHKHLKTITGCKEGKGNDAVHVLNTDKLCTCTSHGSPCIYQMSSWRCSVITKQMRESFFMPLPVWLGLAAAAAAVAVQSENSLVCSQQSVLSLLAS